MKKKGFTLIEMLIVIAVIGVLAIAVLSAINPIEQMRKARDTRRRSNAAELLNALERYYATFEEYGVYSVSDGTNCSAAVPSGLVDSTDMADLLSSNEVKQEFVTRIGTTGNELYGAVDTLGGTELAIVCSQIESQANIEKYTGLPNHCTVATLEYICLPE